MNKLLLVVAAAGILTACASSGTMLTTEDAASFEPGVTTMADVVDRFGEPQGTTTLPDGRKQLTYVYTETQMKAATFVPIVGLFAGGADSQSSAITFSFDPDGVLLDETMRTEAEAEAYNFRGPRVKSNSEPVRDGE